MTVAELLEQAKTLTADEREELIQQLALIQAKEDRDAASNNRHWGQSLKELMDDVGSIEMAYPEIEDSDCVGETSAY